MNVKEFLQIRLSVQPSPDANIDDSALEDSKVTYVPIITPNGTMVSIEKKIKSEELNVSYLTFDNDFMAKLGESFSVNVPLSNFAVFDALSSIKFNPQNEK
jgi:hypothetical protein